jgi:hypothetical protein
LVEDEGWSAPVPEEAIDQHTEEGRRRMTKAERIAHWFETAAFGSPVSGPRDWWLWCRRRAARQGYLDRNQVEQQSMEWDQEGMLRFGSEGYRP